MVPLPGRRKLAGAAAAPRRNPPTRLGFRTECSLAKYGAWASGMRTLASANRAESGF